MSFVKIQFNTDSLSWTWLSRVYVPRLLELKTLPSWLQVIYCFKKVNKRFKTNELVTRAEQQ